MSEEIWFRDAGFILEIQLPCQLNNDQDHEVPNLLC